jgi:hypothetical protein
MDVDETATPKPYSLSSEILYEDADGHDQVSDTVKINTEVMEAKESLPGYQIVTGIAMTLAACFVLFRKKQQRE